MAESKCPNCNHQCGFCGLRSSSRHPVRQTVNLGSDLGDYVLRLRWEPTEDGRVTWVDFDLVEITAMGDGPEYPYQRGMDYCGPDIEKATLAATGFLKWDGCMQFNVAYVHADEDLDLHKLLDAVRMTRVHAAAAMGDDYDG